VSWAAALVMMEVAPARAQQLISRAVSFGNSRIICGLNFPADIEAGHFVGAAVVDNLFTDPVFRRDLLCAKREFNAVSTGQKSEDLPACQF
jgi:acid phosphatase (class A)